MEAPPCLLFRLASPRLRPGNGARAFRIPVIERQPSSMHICRVHSWIDGQRPLNGLRAVRLPSNERLPSSSSQATAFINACSAVNYVAVRSWIAESLSLVSPPHCLLPRDVSRTCCLPTTTTKRLPTSSCRVGAAFNFVREPQRRRAGYFVAFAIAVELLSSPPYSLDDCCVGYCSM